MSREFWSAVALLVSRMLLCEAAGQCVPGETSIGGMALKGHTFKTMEVRRSDECYFRCGEEDACQSYNYVIPDKICELNDQTKDSRPLHFVPDRDRFYMTHMENKEKWLKVNSDPVCFGARGNKYGEFTITKSGQIATFKLLYLSGSVSCNPDFPPSYWGCTNPIFSENKLFTLIAFENKTLVLPGAEDLAKVPPSDCKAKTYSIDGVQVNSPELVFNKRSEPLTVPYGQKLRIWYTQDLTGCSEENNSGLTCLDVYAWYV